MNRKLSVVFSLLVVLCMLALPGLTAVAHALPQWQQVNVVPPNETMMDVTSLAEFHGVLYAGTTHWSAVDLVEVNSAVYQLKDGKKWKKVSPDGFGDPVNNTTIYKMAVFGDKLYAGTGDMTGNGIAQLWRTSNGSQWEAVNTNGFNDPANYLVSLMTVYRGMFYITVENSALGVQLYRSATGNPGSWKKATKVFDDPKYAGYGTTGFITFNEMLYMAVEDETSGVAALWRSKDGANWAPVTTDGFGDAGNKSPGGLAIYKDQLYWGTGNWDGTGAQVWRSRDGKNWSKVLDGGFGDTNNIKVEALISYAGDLYAITTNFATGVEAWRTSDGKKWEQVNQDGFKPGCTIGDGMNCNWSIHNATSSIIFKNSLHVGTWNGYGGEIWKMEAGH